MINASKKTLSWTDSDVKHSPEWITKEDLMRLESSKFTDDYTLGKQLGSGAFAEVFLCTKITTGETRAVKRVDRSFLSDDDEHNLFSEVLLTRRLKNPHVIELFEVYRDDRYYWLVQEIATGGELFDRVAAKEAYTEADARAVSRTLLTAVGMMHAHGIVHRDLKPENVLLVSEDSDTDIKLCDFGFAKHLTLGHDTASDLAGTLAYLAPEILEGKTYNSKVDVFSAGIIVFILLGGYNPFHGRSNKEIKAKILAVEYEFNPDWWSGVSESAKELIRHMLVKDPEERWSCEQLLAHEWFTQCDDDLCHNMERVVQQIRAYQARRKLKAGIQTVASINRIRRLSSMLKMAAGESQASDGLLASPTTSVGSMRNLLAVPSFGSVPENIDQDDHDEA